MQAQESKTVDPPHYVKIKEMTRKSLAMGFWFKKIQTKRQSCRPIQSVEVCMKKIPSWFPYFPVPGVKLIYIEHLQQPEIRNERFHCVIIAWY